MSLSPEDLAVVMRAPLFAAMGPRITHAMLQNRAVRTCHRGETIFQQDDVADAFYVIVDGWVKLYREREQGDQVVVAIFTAGETFAEVAMFLGARFPASAEAISPARLVRIDGAALRRAIIAQPQLAFDMLAAAAMHLRQLVEQIEQLKAQTAPQRIADFFLKQVKVGSGQTVIELPYEKSLIANRLGMQPESFSRALGKLRELGVSVEGDSVRIADVAKLLAFLSR